MKDRDAELLRALRDEHGEALFAHAVRLTGGDRQRAEDLVQETLLRAWRHPEVLDPERGAVRSWLFAAAGNLVHRCPTGPGRRGGRRLASRTAVGGRGGAGGRGTVRQLRMVLDEMGVTR